MEGIRIAIGEMENTHSSIYREYGMFSAPFEYEIQVLLAILAPVPVSILINLFVQTADIIPRLKAKKFWIRASVEFKGHKAESPLTIDVGRGGEGKPFMSKTFPTCRPIRSIAVAGGQELSWKYGGDFERKTETSGYDLKWLTDEQEAVMAIHPFFTGLECPSDQPFYQ